MATRRERSYWTARAEEAIAQASSKWGEATGIDIFKASKLETEALMKAVDEAYPFGVRKNWPYKAWLRCRRKFMDSLPALNDPPAIPTPKKERHPSIVADNSRDI